MKVAVYIDLRIMLEQMTRKELLAVIDAAKSMLTELPEPNADEIALVNSGQVIAAIKSFKTRTGCGLREAKDQIDAIRQV